MPFIKLIQTGNILETYEYDFEPSIPRARSCADRIRDDLVRQYQSEQRVENVVPRFKPSKKLNRSITRARKAFLRLVKANLYGDDFPCILTLTYAENMSDINRGYRDFTRFFNSLKKTLPSLRFIGVPEFQKRGAVHFHVLVWGFPADFVCTGSYRFYRGPTDLKAKKHFVHDCLEEKQCERNTRYLAKRWGFGFLDITPTDGSPKIAGYLAKYMSKSMQDSRLVGKRAYTSSRNLLRPVSVSTYSFPKAVDFILNDFGITDLSSALPLKTQTFQTQFMGKGVYKIFSRQGFEF